MDYIGNTGISGKLLDLQTTQAKLSAVQKDINSTENNAKNTKIREMAEEFEQIFLQNMLSSMMEGTTPEAPFNGGAGEEQWKGFLVNEYAGAIARNGGIGLADSIYQDLIKLQENQ